MKKDSTAYAAPRPFADKADCSIRALACATGTSYEIASMTFSAQGRRLKEGTDIGLSAKVYEDVLGMTRVRQVEGMDLETFTMVAQTGSYILHKKGHAFAVVEGVVNDWEGTTRHSTRIVSCWKVTEQARAKMARMAELVKELS